MISTSKEAIGWTNRPNDGSAESKAIQLAVQNTRDSHEHSNNRRPPVKHPSETAKAG
jgi:hypothetical protein